jgi:hypothetical protein
MANETYGRGQIEWALWCCFTRARARQNDVPQVFRTRIKRLLDIDRDLDLSGQEVAPDSDYAFAAPPASDGSETRYHPVDAFCLGVALDLLDSGFKQSEVVLLMRYLRSDFERSFDNLLKSFSPLDRLTHLAADHPDLPAYEKNGVQYLDNRVFMVLQKIELTEILPRNTRGGKANPVIFEPDFCEGIVALCARLDNLMPLNRRAVTVVELVGMAQAVCEWLSQAPEIRRGRPKG